MDVLKPSKERSLPIERFVAPVALVGSLAILSSILVVSNVNAEYKPVTKPTVDIDELVAEYLAALPSTQNYSVDNSCALDTPTLGAFNTVEMPVLTSSAAIETFLLETYGITVSYQQETIDDYYKTIKGFESPIDEATKLAFVLKLEQSLSNFDPDVIKGLSSLEITAVKSIVDKKHPYAYGGAQGMYVYNDNHAYIDADLSGIWFEHTAVHEIKHAEDGLLCTSEDFMNDQAISLLNQTMPSPIFENDYSKTNVAEDRAEILTTILVDNRLILPGNREWGSALQQKQAEELRRQETMTPGFIAHTIEESVRTAS